MVGALPLRSAAAADGGGAGAMPRAPVRPRSARRSAARRRGAEDDQDGEQEIADGPQPGLGEPPGISEPEPRLDERGVAEQREHAPEIAGGVEEVGVAGGRVPGVREPVLQERRGRAHHEERQAHRDREQDEHAEHRVGLAAGQAARVHAEGQDGEGDGEQRQVQERLPADAEPRRRGVGIGVAAEERGLEEHHAGAPHRGRAAEERQDHLAHHRLHHEQERGADEQRERVEQQDERQAEILQPPIVAAPASFSYGECGGDRRSFMTASTTV